MRILYVLKGSPESLPPVLSQIKNLVELGHKIILLANRITSEFDNFLVRNGSRSHIKFKKSKLKIINWVRFRINVKKQLSSDKYDLIILGSLDTAMACKGIYDVKKSIINIWELYDLNPIYKFYMKYNLRKHPNIICPEYNRAHMLKLHYRLTKLPLVLPNKPEFLGSLTNDIDTELNQKLDLLANRKIILYQGQIYSDRQLEKIAIALSIIDSNEYVFVLLGIDYENIITKIKNIYKNTIYLGYITAPAHLEVTRKAFIGIVNYSENSLNNLYCAPNKIYEYGAFSKPMIGNDIPGLKYTIEANECGKCVNYEDSSSFINALKYIEQNYEYYSQNAYILYEKVNNKKTFSDFLYRLDI